MPTEMLSRAKILPSSHLPVSSQLRAEWGRAVNESVCKLAWNGTDAGER